MTELKPSLVNRIRHLANASTGTTRSQVRKRIIDRRFVDLLASTKKNRRYDLQTAAVIRRVMDSESVGIDVGAHKGDILQHLVAAAPGKQHLAIEPLPELAASLRSKFPSVHVHEVALTDSPTTKISFHHVSSNPAYSGILERRYDRPNESIEMIEVSTARLDDLVPADVAPTFIKIDVEGAEQGVLESGSETIARCRPTIVFEHGLGASDRYGTTPEVIWNYFDHHKLSVGLIATWLEDGPPLGLDQFTEQFHSGVNYYFIAYPK